MSKRLQVVMTLEEYAEIAQAARAERLTVSAWVRRVLREARRGGASAPAAVVREPGARYGADSAAGRAAVEVDAELLERAAHRLGLADPSTVAEYALRRVAVAPMSRVELLAAEGSGWDGDLAEMRSRARPDGG